MRVLRRWMKKSTSEQIEKLAEAAGTSRTYLYMISEGLRVASSEMADQIERASQKLNTLPKLYRGDICPTCAECPYYKKCKK